MAIDSLTVLKSRFVQSADGTEIYADAAGNRSLNAPVIVMIPGFTVVKAVFDPIFEDSKWTSNAFLVRYDPRGQGRSGMPLNDEAWEAHCISEDFEAVCKEFGITKAFVLGWSLGATHSTDIMKYKTSVSVSGFINVVGIPCIDQTSIFRVGTPESLPVFPGLLQNTDVDVFQQAALNFTSLLSDHFSPELSRKLLEGVILTSRKVAVKLAGRNQDKDVIMKIGQGGEVELLMVTCGKDRVANSTEMKAIYDETMLKKYEYRHLEDGDHIPWLSVPDAFRETVLGWVRERHWA